MNTIEVMFKAIFCGAPSALHPLLSHGVGVSWQDPVMGGQPLHWASMYGHVGILEILVKHGASLNARTVGGQHDSFKIPGMQPIHLAAKGGQIHAFEWLVQKGAKATSKDGSGKTALQIAKDAGHVKFVAWRAEVARNSAATKAGAQPKQQDDL